MACIIHGDKTIVYGSRVPSTPVGFPEGKLEWLIAPDEFVRARIEVAPGSFRQFYVREWCDARDMELKWSPGPEIEIPRTARQHFAALPEPYCSQAIANSNAWELDEEVASQVSALFESFDWRKSPEGWSYWNEFLRTIAETP